MSLNPGVQNIENLGNSVETLRLIFRALHFSFSSRDRRCMVQSRRNARAKTLCFPACVRKHCSIDLSFSFARGARLKKS